ncbi:hypothetical protein D1136_10800 [Odoribacter sp. Z80]|nr:hypothetical protein [Odoribacter sp. Z80]
MYFLILSFSYFYYFSFYYLCFQIHRSFSNFFFCNSFKFISAFLISVISAILNVFQPFLFQQCLENFCIFSHF